MAPAKRSGRRRRHRRSSGGYALIVRARRRRQSRSERRDRIKKAEIAGRRYGTSRASTSNPKGSIQSPTRGMTKARPPRINAQAIGTRTRRKRPSRTASIMPRLPGTRLAITANWRCSLLVSFSTRGSCVIRHKCLRRGQRASCPGVESRHASSTCGPGLAFASPRGDPRVSFLPSVRATGRKTVPRSPACSSGALAQLPALRPAPLR